MLSEPEFLLLMEFTGRPAHHQALDRCIDDIAPMGELCEDEGERATFASILAKAASPFTAEWSYYGRSAYGLRQLCVDLSL